MQNQHVEGEPDLDSKDLYLRKQEGLRLLLEKTYVGYVIGESQNFRYPDNEKHSLEGKGKDTHVCRTTPMVKRA
jgi:hypothetical protein